MLYMSLQIVDAIIITLIIRIFYCAREKRTICQKLYHKRKLAIQDKNEDKRKEEVNNAPSDITEVIPDPEFLELQVVERCSNTGFYTPMNRNEVDLEDPRERAFSVWGVGLNCYLILHVCIFCQNTT